MCMDQLGTYVLALLLASLPAEALESASGDFVKGMCMCLQSRECINGGQGWAAPNHTM
jgi:hypothetical protein